MDGIPRPPLRLHLFRIALRRRDIPINITQWKVASIIVQGALLILAAAFGNTLGALVCGVFVAQHVVELTNLKFGPWGSATEGMFYCDVYSMIVRGNNIVQMVSTCLAEMLLLYFFGGVWASVAILLHCRFDNCRFSFPEPTEQAHQANDLEALHTAQPPRPPLFSPDLAFSFIIPLCAYNHYVVMLYLFLRALLHLARDLGSISAIQNELYIDVLSIMLFACTLSL